MKNQSIMLKFFISKGIWKIWSSSKNGGSVALRAGQGAGGQGSRLAVLVLPHCVTPRKPLILPVLQLIIRQKIWGRDLSLLVVLWMP